MASALYIYAIQQTHLDSANDSHRKLKPESNGQFCDIVT